MSTLRNFINDLNDNPTRPPQTTTTLPTYTYTITTGDTNPATARLMADDVRNMFHAHTPIVYADAAFQGEWNNIREYSNILLINTTRPPFATRQVLQSIAHRYNQDAIGLQVANSQLSALVTPTTESER